MRKIILTVGFFISLISTTSAQIVEFKARWSCACVDNSGYVESYSPTKIKLTENELSTYTPGIINDVEDLYKVKNIKDSVDDGKTMHTYEIELDSDGYTVYAWIYHDLLRDNYTIKIPIAVNGEVKAYFRWTENKFNTD